jgi:type VI secretion system protein ImpL
VEDHFAPVRRLAEGQNGAPPPIDDALAGLGELRNKLQEAAAQPNPDEAFAKMGPGAITQLVQSARGLPSPLNDMVGGLAGKAQSLAAGGARRQINDAWRTGVLPFCQSALTGRYPFAGASAVDARLDDVTRLFAPGQMIDGFVTGQLGPYVDMTKEPWRDSQSIGLSRGALGALQRAKRIRDSLFPTGTFKVRFTLTPQGLDADSDSVVLDLDGQEMRYSHDALVPMSLSWPGPAGTSTVRLTFVSPTKGPVTQTLEGPWSLFRLLQQGSIASTGQPDQFLLTLRYLGHQATFKLDASSVANAFDPNLLVGFSCPEAL